MKRKRVTENKYQTNMKMFDQIVQKKEGEEKEALAGLSYPCYLYVILEKKIAFEEIQYYLLKVLENNGRSIPFYEFLKPTILQHISEIINKEVEEYWKYENSQISKQKSTNQIYTKYEQNRRGQSKQSIKNRIKSLQENLALCQMKMNNSRAQQEIKQCQNQYKSLFAELSYWKNKKRRVLQMKKLAQIKLPHQIEHKDLLNEVIEEMVRMREQSRKKVSEGANGDGLTKEEELRRLKLIFTTYAIKGSSNKKYFSDIATTDKQLSAESFVKLVKDLNLNRILKVEEMNRIFKKLSKGKGYIEEVQFYSILTQIHQQQCEQEGIPFSPATLGNFISQIVQKKNISPLLSNKGKEQKYKFIPSTHSGKYNHDIQQQLNEKKKSIQYLASPKNKVKYLSIKKSTLDVKSYVNSSRKTNNETFSLSKNNSYMSRFEARKGRKKLLTEPQQIREQKSIIEYLEKDQRKEINTNNEEDEVLGELRDLIQVRQQDQYLNKHLLPPIQQKRVLRKIHF